MKIHPYWNFKQLLLGFKYVNGTFAHTFYVHLGFLNWDIFVVKK